MAAITTTGLDHVEALARCRNGDVAGLRSLYEAEAGFLLAIATRIVRHREMAEDVLHDAFLQIWRGARTFDPVRGAPRAWLVTIVRNTAYRKLKKTSADQPLNEVELAGHADDAPSPCDLAELADDAHGLRKCLTQLDEHRRETILLAYVEGLSHSEIAGRIGAPLGSVKAWIRRGLQSLRKCLG